MAGCFLLAANKELTLVPSRLDLPHFLFYEFYKGILIDALGYAKCRVRAGHNAAGRTERVLIVVDGSRNFC